jgi:ketosteroid isomerase-like protein
VANEPMIRFQPRIDRRRTATLFAALLLGAVLAVVAGCRRATPEQALRRDLSALQSAIEARDASKMRSFLADDFIGNDGLDRDGARRLAALHFMRNDQVGVTIGPLDVAVQDNHATVRCTAFLTGGQRGGLPDAAQIQEVISGWRLDDGTWRMTSLAWTPR